MGSAATTALERCPDSSSAPVMAPEPVGTLAQQQPIILPAPSMTEQEREKLILAHLPQVRRVAKTFHKRLPRAVDLNDLIGYGVVGLLHAINRFDLSRGILLKTYAEHRIRGAILDGLRTMDWLSRSARQKQRQYQQSLCEPPPAPASPAAPVSEAGNTTRPTATRGLTIEVVCAGSQLEELEKFSERLGLRDTVAGITGNPETLYQEKQARLRLCRALAHLPRRHRQIVQLYYYGDLRMKQIAQILRVHESRVSQIHNAVLKRLRDIPTLHEEH